MYSHIVRITIASVPPPIHHHHHHYSTNSSSSSWATNIIYNLFSSFSIFIWNIRSFVCVPFRFVLFCSELFCSVLFNFHCVHAIAFYQVQDRIIVINYRPEHFLFILWEIQRQITRTTMSRVLFNLQKQAGRLNYHCGCAKIVRDLSSSSARTTANFGAASSSIFNKSTSIGSINTKPSHRNCK